MQADTTIYVCDLCTGDAYSKQTKTGKTVWECSNPNHKNAKNPDFQYCMWKKPVVKGGQQQAYVQGPPQGPPANQVPQPQFPQQPNLTISNPQPIQYLSHNPTLPEVKHVENYELSSEMARLREVVFRQNSKLEEFGNILRHMDEMLTKLINTEERAQAFVETGIKKTRFNDTDYDPRLPQN